MRMFLFGYGSLTVQALLCCVKSPNILHSSSCEATNTLPHSRCYAAYLQVRYKVAIFQMIIELMDNQQANYRVCRVHYMLTFLLACEDREMLQIDGKFASICMLIFLKCATKSALINHFDCT